MKFRKRPVVIDAIRLMQDNVQEIKEMCGTKIELRGVKTSAEDDFFERLNGDKPLEAMITTLEGRMHASEGDWIIKGVNGEFYSCKDDIFNKTYEPVNNISVGNDIEW